MDMLYTAIGKNKFKRDRVCALTVKFKKKLKAI